MRIARAAGDLGVRTDRPADRHRNGVIDLLVVNAIHMATPLEIDAVSRPPAASVGQAACGLASDAFGRHATMADCRL